MTYSAGLAEHIYRYAAPPVTEGRGQDAGSGPLGL